MRKLLRKVAQLVVLLNDKNKPYRKTAIAVLGVVASAAYLYLTDNSLSSEDLRLLGLELLAALGVYGVRNKPRQ